MKRYQLIGFPEVEVSDYDAQFKQCLTFDPLRALKQICYAHTSYVTCHHLELMDVTNWRSHSENCCGVVLDTIEKLPQDDCWFPPVYHAMLCGSFAGLSRDLDLLASIDFYRFEEDYLGRDPQELQYVLLEVLYSLSSDKPQKSKAAQDAFTNTKNRKSLRYLSLWRAVESEDQEAFASILLKSLKSFSQRKKPPADATFPLEWIAQYESIVANFAVCRGLVVPDLPPKLAALLMLNTSDPHSLR